MEWKLIPKTGVGTRKLETHLDRQRVGNTMAEIACPFWLQARRARSDAPYHAGRATGLFDFIAHFGVRIYWNNTLSYPNGGVSVAAYYDPPGGYDYQWSGN